MGGDKDGCPFGGGPVDHLPEFAACHWVHATGRLVEEHHFGSMDGGGREREFLFPSGRDVPDKCSCHVLHPEGAEHTLHSHADFCVGHAVDCGEQPQVLGHGQVLVKREFLAHVAYVSLYLLRLPDNVESGHGAGAGCRAAQAAQHSHGCGLAGAVGSEKAENLTSAHIEADVVHSREAAEAFHQIPYRYCNVVIHFQQVL